jgi:hypothetical protein
LSIVLVNVLFAFEHNQNKASMPSALSPSNIGDSSNFKISTNIPSSHSLEADIGARFNPGEIALRWTAPGDDGNSGRATGYDLRYRPVRFGPIDSEVQWATATPVIGEPQPSWPGQRDSITVQGLEYGQAYYFCLKTYDESRNYSALSNSPLIVAGDTLNDTSDFIPGDVNGDGFCRGTDVVCLISFFHGEAPPPRPFLAGDANGDCYVNLADATYLIRFFKGFGNAPTRGNCGWLGKLAFKTPSQQ